MSSAQSAASPFPRQNSVYDSVIRYQRIIYSAAIPDRLVRISNRSLRHTIELCGDARRP